MINRSLDAEMDVHLGYERHAKADADSTRANRRNGKSAKTIKGDFGELDIETPRDRDGSFEPQLVKKRQIRLTGMEDKILALYAKGRAWLLPIYRLTTTAYPLRVRPHATSRT